MHSANTKHVVRSVWSAQRRFVPRSSQPSHPPGVWVQLPDNHTSQKANIFKRKKFKTRCIIL